MLKEWHRSCPSYGPQLLKEFLHKILSIHLPDSDIKYFHELISAIWDNGMSCLSSFFSNEKRILDTIRIYEKYQDLLGMDIIILIGYSLFDIPGWLIDKKLSTILFENFNLNLFKNTTRAREYFEVFNFARHSPRGLESCFEVFNFMCRSFQGFVSQFTNINSIEMVLKNNLMMVILDTIKNLKREMYFSSLSVLAKCESVKNYAKELSVTLSKRIKSFIEKKNVFLKVRKIFDLIQEIYSLSHGKINFEYNLRDNYTRFILRKIIIVAR